MKLNVTQLATMQELTGKLTVLNDEESFEVVLIELDNRSKEKIAKSVLYRGSIRENQDLFIPSMLIASEGKDLILKGQSNLKETSTGMVYAANSPIKTRFKGEFQTIIGINEDVLTINIILGNIEFEIDAQRVNIGEEGIMIENARAMLFPSGTYSVQVLEE